MRIKNIILIAFISILFLCKTKGQQNSYAYNLIDGNEYGINIELIGDQYLLASQGVCHPNGGPSTICANVNFIDEYGNLVSSRTFETWFKYAERRSIQELNDEIVIFGAKQFELPVKWNLFYTNANADSTSLIQIDDFEEDVVYPTAFQIKNNHLFILGRTFFTPGNEEDLILLKTDAQGNKIKEERFHSVALPEYQNVGWDFIQTSDNHFIIGLTSLGPNRKFAQLIKFNDNLDIIWSKIYNTVSHPYNHPDLAPLENGEFVFTWGLYTPDIIDSLGDQYKVFGKQPATIHKLDAEGNFIWSDTLWTFRQNTSPAPRANLHKVIPTSDGNIIAAGEFNRLTTEEKWAYIIKYDSNGNRIWEKIYSDKNLVGNTYFLDIEEAPNGDLVCTGEILETNGEWNNASYAWLLRLDAEGCFEDGCQSQDSIQHILTESLFTTSISDLPQKDVTDHPISIYPNPATDFIQVQLPNPIENACWILKDFSGKTILIGTVSSPISELSIDIQSVPNGIYFIELYHQNRKMYSSSIVKM